MLTVVSLRFIGEFVCVLRLHKTIAKDNDLSLITSLCETVAVARYA